MAEATLSSKNQIVIPREAREALDLKPGDKLVIRAHAGKILILEKPKSYRTAIRGLMRRGYDKGYLRQERNSWE
jgi:AbrB family looped-hinge helix DNA binding protein